jgi:HipA-like protein
MNWKPPSFKVATPEAVGKIKTSGRTEPIEMRCQSDGVSEEYVVKLWGNVELGVHSLARELYAALLGSCFEITMPPVALINITTEFPASQPDPVIRNRLNASLGLNFGSQVIAAPLIFSPPAAPAEIAGATKIYCFDLLIGNLDRRPQKVNLFQSAEGFIAIDHEQAFPFSMPQTMVGGYPAGWDFIQEDWTRAHVLYSSLKGKDCFLEIESFITKLSSIKDEILVKIEKAIPGEWYTDALPRIAAYIANTRDNAGLFMRSLQELLA